MAHFIVPEKCKAHGDCVAVCPVSCISQGGEKNSSGIEFFVIDPEVCIDCGACAGVCPIAEAIESGH